MKDLLCCSWLGGFGIQAAKMLPSTAVVDEVTFNAFGGGGYSCNHPYIFPLKLTCSSLRILDKAVKYLRTP